jgi:outer membrane lipoprotein SlyB
MRRIFLIALVAGLAGCAQSYQPVVDPKGVDNAKYQQDLAECRQLAEQVNPYERAAVGTAIGAIGGAALGAVTGAVVGSPGAGAAIGAGAGGLTGAAVGGGTGVEQQKKIIDNCLKNRGYAVLN